MAEEETETDTGALDKLLDVVQNYKSNEQSGSNTGGWIAGLVVLVIALIGVAIFAYQQWKAGKERAKLLHERAVALEQQHQAELDHELAEKEAEKQAHLDAALEAYKRASEIDKRRAELVKVRDEARAKIDRITSWEDVDAIVR